MKANKLKGKIIEKGLSVEKLAEIVGIDKSTFYRRLSDFDTFTIGEVAKIKDALGLSKEEAYELFID